MTTSANDERDGISRGIVKYTSRDYLSILDDLIEGTKILTDLWNPKGDTAKALWKPEATADPGYVLMTHLASVADMLGINTDIQANELYAPSVQQRKNAEKIFGLIGYDLGFWTAARTEVTFQNNTSEEIVVDFGFNGSNFCTMNAYTDITNTARVLTYNILPMTNSYGALETRSRRSVLTENLNIFADTDEVHIPSGGSVTRVAIEGELRSYSISVEKIKANNYIINLPSQHLDTTAIWIKAKSSLSSPEFLTTQWIQCTSPAEFIQPEPRFAVTYDSYSNAQIQISNYLNQLQNYDGNWLTVYWIDCSGIIGCVGKDVLTNFIPAKTQNIPDDFEAFSISNLSNTVELPHTYTVTGKSPETAKEAYVNSRNYINTYDSLVTLPDFNRFLRREAGVDTGYVIDCQKALEINLAIYNDENLTTSQKAKKYITNYDFPEGDPIFDWGEVLNLGFDPTDPQKFVFAANFARYTAMCFAVHNDYKASVWGQGQTSVAQIQNSPKFVRYKPPQQFINNVIRDYDPLQTMTVELSFGYTRLFPFYIVGTITPVKNVTEDVAALIIKKVKEALALHFAPSNRVYGEMPTLLEIIDVIENADDRIRHFDPGSVLTGNYGVIWQDCDIDYFNAISLPLYKDPGESSDNIRIHPTYIIKPKNY